MKSETNLINQLIQLIQKLQKENNELKYLLKANKIPLSSSIENDTLESIEEYDLDQASRIIDERINYDVANKFFYMFWGRMDVFARRGKNGGYFTQCDNRWNSTCPIYNGKIKKCEKDCANRKYSTLSKEIIYKHLNGSDSIGIYPLFENNTCRFIVFDFDNHNKDDKNNDEWISEVNALRQICKENEISCLVERSRSGNGAHVWILFSEPIKASKARYFGLLLLNKGMNSVDIGNFKYFDRIYPSQDEKESLGSLIALPHQGQALKQGNSAFVDENYNAYPKQLDYLFHNADKYSNDEIDVFIKKWQSELYLEDNDYLLFDEKIKPWRRTNKFNSDDVIGYIDITLADGIYVSKANLLARLKNQIRSLAAFDNPVYYRNKKLSLSNYNNSSVIYSGEDIGGYIHLPRGVYDKLIEKIKEANIEYRINSERKLSKSINVSFNGQLKPEQEKAVDAILEFNDGILEAATAFGKTVVCSYLIACKKVSTLILLQSSSLLEQWKQELDKFLIIDEELPNYKTKTGLIKKRSSLIGELQGSRNTLTGIIDIAMIGSLTNKENVDEILSNYGMVIFDECHHAASNSAVNILKKVKSKYLYGVSATPYRSDKLEKINYMYLGPIRYSYSSKQKLASQKIEHYIYPRYTRIVDTYSSKNSINSAYALILENTIRNEQIISDALKCAKQGRATLVLTKQKDHAKKLYDSIKNNYNDVYLIYGENSEKQNNEIINELKTFPTDKSFILIATGQKIGEGFDLPRLDTLLLAAPVSFEGRVEQYLGRLNRDYPNKKDVYVYDYIDSHMRYFSSMYFKRLKAYKRIGYKVIADIEDKQKAHTIFDSYNYLEVFEKDILSANKSTVISSPKLSREKVDRFIEIIKPIQEKGVDVRIICSSWTIDDANVTQELAFKLNNLGIETIIKEDMKSCYAVIDEELVWHGGMNLLGKADYYDNLMRFMSKETAAELLEFEVIK